MTHIRFLIVKYLHFARSNKMLMLIAHIAKVKSFWFLVFLQSLKVVQRYVWKSSELTLIDFNFGVVVGFFSYTTRFIAFSTPSLILLLIKHLTLFFCGNFHAFSPCCLLTDKKARSFSIYKYIHDSSGFSGRSSPVGLRFPSRTRNLLLTEK